MTGNWCVYITDRKDHFIVGKQVHTFLEKVPFLVPDAHKVLSIRLIQIWARAAYIASFCLQLNWSRFDGVWVFCPSNA